MELRVVVRTDGEIVRLAVPHIGYLHRCKEKCAEAVTYPQFIPYTDRLDYLASMSNNFAFCWAVEKLAGYEVPIRAEYIRVMSRRASTNCFSPLSRSVPMDSTLAPSLPFSTHSVSAKILDIFERLCGARLTYSYGRIGGVMRDLDAETIRMIEEFLG